MLGSLPCRDGSPSSPARPPSRPCAGVGNNAASARCSFPDVACGLGRGRRIDAPSLFRRAREQQRGTPLSGAFAVGSNAAAAARYGRRGLSRGSSGVQWRLLLLLGTMLAFIAVHFVHPVASFQIVTGNDDSDEDDEDTADEGDDNSSNNSRFFGSNQSALPRVTIVSAAPLSSPFKKTIAARVLARGKPTVSRVALLKRFPRLSLASEGRQEGPSMMRLQPPARHMLRNIIAALRERQGLSVPKRVRMFATPRDNEPVDSDRSSWTSSTPAESPLPVSPFTMSASPVPAGEGKVLFSSSSEVPDSATSAIGVTHHAMIGGDPGKVTSWGHSTIQRFRNVNGQLKKTYHRTSVLGRDGELHVMESHHPTGGTGPMSALGALRSALRGRLGDGSSDKNSSSSGRSSGGSGIAAAPPGALPGGPGNPEFWGHMFDGVVGKLKEHLRRSPKMHRSLKSVLKRRMDIEKSLARKILDENLSVPEKVNEGEIDETVKMLRVKLSRRPAVLIKLVRMLGDNHPTALEDLEDFIRHLDIE